MPIKRRRFILGVLWFFTSLGAICATGYPALSLWLERNTIVVHVVDSDGDPVPNAEVSWVLLSDFVT